MNPVYSGAVYDLGLGDGLKKQVEDDEEERKKKLLRYANSGNSYTSGMSPAVTDLFGAFRG